MLQQHRVVLHAAWIPWSNEKQSRSTSLHNQFFYRAKTFSPPPVMFRLNSKRRLEIDFLEYNCGKTQFLFWGKVGKCSQKKYHPCLMKSTLNMNSCLIHYNAPLEEHVNVTQWIYSFGKKLFIFRQFQLNFSVCDVCIVSVTVNYNIQLVHISPETFLLSFILHYPIEARNFMNFQMSNKFLFSAMFQLILTQNEKTYSNE